MADKKKFLLRLLKIKIARVMLAVFSNFIPNHLKKFVEKRFVNLYDFDDTNLPYAEEQLDKILSVTNFENKVILELGPGGSYSLGCLMLKAGAKHIFLLDSETHVSISEKNLNFYKNIFPDSTDGKMLNTKKITVSGYENNFSIPISDESCDLIYSNAVFEHIKNPEITVSECRRVLKKGGIMIHQVDLRDHLYDQGSLSFLKIPDLVFNFLFSNTSAWVNRLRYSDWVNIFHKYDFEIKKAQKQQEGVIIPKSIGNNHTKEDLETTSVFFVLKK